MTTRISIDNFQQSAIETIGTSGSAVGPTISSIAVANSSYTILDDTAVDVNGGYVVITGTNFAANCQVVINDVAATNTIFVSANTIHAQVPARSAGTYIVYVINADGGVAIRVNGLTYSALPTWVTGSTLPSEDVDEFISINLSATEANSYTLQAGSSLPPGLTLSANGYLFGTVTGISSETTYNFTVIATDPELQDSPRTFNITIITGDPYFNSVTTLISGDTTSNTFISDASTNNFQSVIIGDTKSNDFNPFREGYYSNYFDGTGDSLSFTNTNNQITFGTDNFTIEYWVNFNNPRATNTYEVVLRNYNTDPFVTDYFYLGKHASATVPGAMSFWLANFAGSLMLSDPSLPAAGWSHYAIVRNGNTWTMYRNGTSVHSVTSSVSMGTRNNNLCQIGVDLSGYISNLRVVKGTAVYTSNFTPSTTPLTAITNTSLLTCQSNRIKDNSTNNFSITRSGDVSVQPFNPLSAINATTDGSGYFDGSGDGVNCGSQSAFALGTGAFCIEGWVYNIALKNYSCLWTTRPNNGSHADAYHVGWGADGGGSLYVNTTGYAAWSAGGIKAGQWQHIAVTRNSAGNLATFIDGVRVGYTASLTTNFTRSLLGLGDFPTTQAESINGYISNARIVKGDHVYDPTLTTCTVPTSPLTAIANTSILTVQTNVPVNNNTFTDRARNAIITRNGNPTQGTFSPYGENWSNYFDGTGDNLSIAGNSAFSFPGDFTIEFWVYLLTNSNTSPSYMLMSLAGSTFFAINMQAGSYISAFLNTGSPALTSTDVVPVQNAWSHIALVRSGSTVKIYVNGVASSSTATNSSTLGSSTDTFNISNGSCPASYISNFRVVKGTAVYTTNFTPSTTPLQPIANTSLLTCRDGSFVDDGPNRFAITRNGDVTVQKFSPFLTTALTTPYFSNYFDGTGDVLNVAANSAFAFGTGDFSVEFWAYISTWTSDAQLIGAHTAFVGFDFLIQQFTSGQFRYLDSSLTLQSGTVPTTNQWNHYAVTRSGTTLRIFLNGIQVASGTSTANIPSTRAIGIMGDTGGSATQAGYVSNVRIVKGTAVYTTNFTPSTTPLTVIANTSLLTSRSNTIIDLSNNNFAITATGNTTPSVLSPFTVSYTTKQAYTPEVFGGSMYFDGTGDYLSVPSQMDVGTSDFTIQAWVHPTAWTVEWNSIFSTRATSSTGGATDVWVLGVHNTGYPYIYSGAFQIQGSAGQVRLGNWTHLCVTRSGSTMRMFVNGVQVASSTSSQNYNVSAAAIGANRNGSEQWTGYLSDVSLLKGRALYTSSFVPPNRKVTVDTNAVLLLDGTNAAIFDSSMKNDLETVGDIRLSSAIKKYGNTSIFFDGTGDHLIIPDSPILELSSANFTIEMWIKTTASTQYTTLVSRDTATTFATGMWTLLMNNSSAGAGDLALWLANHSTSGPLVATTGVSVRDDVWHHIALVRNGSTWTIYIDGTSRGSGTSSATVADIVGNLYIGADQAYSRNYLGYIDDLRITKGIARYTTNFTPPTKLLDK